MPDMKGSRVDPGLLLAKIEEVTAGHSDKAASQAEQGVPSRDRIESSWGGELATNDSCDIQTERKPKQSSQSGSDCRSSSSSNCSSSDNRRQLASSSDSAMEKRNAASTQVGRDTRVLGFFRRKWTVLCGKRGTTVKEIRILPDHNHEQWLWGFASGSSSSRSRQSLSLNVLHDTDGDCNPEDT